MRGPRSPSAGAFAWVPLTILPALLAVAALPRPAEAFQVPDDQEPAVTVSGRGEVEAEPDRAVIYFAVETEGESAREAGEANAALMTEVTAAVRAAAQGIDGFEVTTSGYSLSPRYTVPEGDRIQEISGYVARNSLQVTVDDVSRVGTLIDTALGAGANRVANLSFEVRDPEPFRAEALRDAVLTARAEAEVMANALGMVLGPAIDVQGGADVPYPMPYFQRDMAYMEMAAQAAPTPIEAGPLTITASVTIRFRLDPAQ
jgi:uncharacterized protein YggE